MVIVFWLVALAALYVGLWFLLVGMQAAWQSQRLWLALVLLTPLIMLGIPYSSVPSMLALFGGASVLAGATCVAAATPGGFCRDWWLRLSNARRESALQLALASGAIVFLIPFAWLVVTSFKDDIDMGKFPPVWIPRRQVTIEADGRHLPYGHWLHDGNTFEVAVVEELASGDRRVRVLSPGELQDREFDIRRDQFTPERKVGLKWENYRDAIGYLPADTGHGLLFLINTLTLVTLSIIGTLLSSSLVAYAFARLRFPGRDALFFVLLATMMLPGAVTMLPTFLVFRALGWVDTLKPLWVPAFFASAFNVFLLRQFFLTIPRELEEAARIDGSGYLGTFWRIMLPQIKPALAAVTIWTFMGAWNNFMGPVIYINSAEKMPVSYALQLFQQQHGGEPGMMMAASTLVMLPVILVFFFTQRYFIQGVTLTGIKG